MIMHLRKYAETFISQLKFNVVLPNNCPSATYNFTQCKQQLHCSTARWRGWKWQCAVSAVITITVSRPSGLYTTEYLGLSRLDQLLSLSTLCSVNELSAVLSYCRLFTGLHDFKCEVTGVFLLRMRFLWLKIGVLKLLEHYCRYLVLGLFVVQ